MPALATCRPFHRHRPRLRLRSLRPFGSVHALAALAASLPTSALAQAAPSPAPAPVALPAPAAAPAP
ncbi:MAG TPA: hypothetical protein VIW29_21365, partial [Polyangiaceae bacterium]